MAPTEPIEAEIKIPVTDLEPIRRSLDDAGALLIQPMAREINLLFDSANREIRDAGSLLRLRRHATTKVLTFKGPASFRGTIKERPEYETEIDDLERMGEILEHLGFVVFMRYEKDREEWRLGVVSVVLDHTPMGDFVEVEGPPQQLDQTAQKIGLDVSGAVRGSYVGLWQEYRSTHPEFDLPVDMVFAE